MTRRGSSRTSYIVSVAMTTIKGYIEIIERIDIIFGCQVGFADGDVQAGGRVLIRLFEVLTIDPLSRLGIPAYDSMVTKSHKPTQTYFATRKAS